MARKKVNIAIAKLKEHSDKVLLDLGGTCTEDDFVEEYKKQYPEEYEKYKRDWAHIIKEQKLGKGTPPNPEKYFKLAYNNAMARKKKNNI